MQTFLLNLALLYKVLNDKTFFFPIYLIAINAMHAQSTQQRSKYNFNSGWKVVKDANTTGFDDARWKSVTLPPETFQITCFSQ